MGLSSDKLINSILLTVAVLGTLVYLSIFIFLLSDLRSEEINYPLPRPTVGAVTTAVSPFSAELAVELNIRLKSKQY